MSRRKGEERRGVGDVAKTKEERDARVRDEFRNQDAARRKGLTLVALSVKEGEEKDA